MTTDYGTLLDAWKVMKPLIQFNDMQILISRFKILFVLMLLNFTLSTSQIDPTLKALIEEAKKNNPELNSLRASVDAAQGEALQAGAQPAPQLMGELAQRRERMAHGDLESMRAYGVTLKQMWMWPGKTRSMRNAMLSDADSRKYQAEDFSQTLEENISQAYFELYMLQEQLALNIKQQTIMDKFAAISTRMYETGMAKAEDFLRARTEIAKLKTTESQLLAKQQEMISMLGFWIGRTAFILSDSITLTEPIKIDSDESQLADKAVQARNDLKAMSSMIEMAKAQQHSAKLQNRPDFMTEARWMPMTGPDEWALMAGITLPWVPWANSNPKGEIRKSNSQLMNLEFKKKSMENMIRAEIHSVLQEMQSEYRRTELAENELFPLAELTRKSSEAAYRAGKTEFLMVLDAYRMEYMAREEIAMTKASWHMAHAKWMRLMGVKE